MTTDIAHALAALTFVSVALHLLFVLFFAVRSRRAITPDAPLSRLEPASDLPSVSILKPCAGADDDLEACLRSFCALRYPRFEILCGVRDDDDAALPVLERVRAAYPSVSFRIVRTQHGRSVNPKVAQLEVLGRAAAFDTQWISDSNTRVHPDTLASMARDLARPGVGLVLSPVVGVGEKTLGAALDNLHLSSFVTFGTFGVQALAGRVIAPGKSALVRRRTLDAIGGFEELGRYCAEDYVLVERIRARGEKIVVGEHMVANVNVHSDVKKFYRRHFRWTQMHWLLERGTALEPLLFPMLFALAWFVTAPSIDTFAMLVAVSALQCTVDRWVITRMRGHAMQWRWIGAALMRPLFFAALWLCSPLARKIVWRGNVRWLGAETVLLEERPVGIFTSPLPR